MRSVKLINSRPLALTKGSRSSDITVAAVQFQARASVEGNTNVIVEEMRECAAQNVRVAVFHPQGRLFYRYAKTQLVGGADWAVPGNLMAVFTIDDIPCPIIICHDDDTRN